VAIIVGQAQGINGLSCDSDAVIQGSVDVDRYERVVHDTSYTDCGTDQHPTLCDEINIVALSRFGGDTIG
jgi:hypothetical protein